MHIWIQLFTYFLKLMLKYWIQFIVIFCFCDDNKFVASVFCFFVFFFWSICSDVFYLAWISIVNIVKHLKYLWFGLSVFTYLRLNPKLLNRFCDKELRIIINLILRKFLLDKSWKSVLVWASLLFLEGCTIIGLVSSGLLHNINFTMI